MNILLYFNSDTYTLYYERRFDTHKDAIEYIQGRELSEDIIEHKQANGITVYLAGNVPHVYILLASEIHAEHPVIIGKFCVRQ